MIELLCIDTEQVVITVELHESIMKCPQEVMFIVADQERKSCHGIVMVFDIDNERMDLVRNFRKRRAPYTHIFVIVGDKDAKTMPVSYIYRKIC